MGLFYMARTFRRKTGRKTRSNKKSTRRSRRKVVGGMAVLTLLIGAGVALLTTVSNMKVELPRSVPNAMLSYKSRDGFQKQVYGWVNDKKEFVTADRVEDFFDNPNTTYQQVEACDAMKKLNNLKLTMIDEKNEYTKPVELQCKE